MMPMRRWLLWAAIASTMAFPRITRGDLLPVVPSCNRTDGGRRPYFWIHVRVPFTYRDKVKGQQSRASLFSLTCKARRGAPGGYACSGVQIDLDRTALGYLNVNAVDMDVIHHRGSTTILDWGLHTMTVRWDRGTVELEFDPRASNLSATKYETATCGARRFVAEKVEDETVWTWGEGRS